jgi:hypothetical protein
MAELITQEYFQSQMATLGLKASFAPSADQLAVLITEASDWTENYCDRKFEAQSVTEARWGPVRADARLVAENYPVNTMASAYAGDTPLDVADLRIRPGGILEWKTSYHWLPEVYYTLTYDTGYSVIPSNVQRAVALKIATLLQPQYQGPAEREIFMVTNLEAMIIDLLEVYRRERYG